MLWLGILVIWVWTRAVEVVNIGCMCVFTARENGLGCPTIRKYGIVFLGRHASMADTCIVNWGQLLLLELACLEEMPQETQCESLG